MNSRNESQMNGNLFQRSLRRLRRSFGRQTHPREGMRSVTVIVNPAAGQDKPFLKQMNTLFKDAGLDYEVMVTKKTGDATWFAQKAIDTSASIVAVYGGDGTIIETAMGLAGSSVPLAILPGGTANMMSKAFNISQNFADACSLMLGDDVSVRPVPLAVINDQPFMQLAGIGMEAKIVESADRATKDRLGMLAYGLGALQALTGPELAHYHLELDGQPVDVDGVTCLIALVENLGMSSLAKALDISSHPGTLDVVVLQQANLGAFIALLPALVSGTPPTYEGFQHWHARQVKVTASPEQSVQADGEILGTTPVTASIMPNSVNVIVPKPASPS